MFKCKNYVRGVFCEDLFDVERCTVMSCHECAAYGSDRVRRFIPSDRPCRTCKNRHDDFAVIYNRFGDCGIMCSNMDLED